MVRVSDILFYYNARAIGHTYLMMEGVKSALNKGQRVAVVVANKRVGEVMVEGYGINPRDRNLVLVTPGGFQKLIGMHIPVVWDNSAIVELASECARRERQVRRLERTIDRIKEALDVKG